MDYGLLFAVASVAVGALIWSIRQEGRINKHDTLFEERDKQASDRHQEIVARLERIERKQDAANGKH